MNFILSSIRIKMTLVLLFVGLLSIIFVGLISRGIMLDRFNALIVEEAARGFISEAGDYYQAYGSWERARNTETFAEFVRRTRPNLFANNGTARANRPPANRSNPPQDGDRPAQGRNFSYGGPPPPFNITDELGLVEVPLFADYEVGDLVPQELLDLGIPIMADGIQVGLAIPEQRPQISRLEERYLSVFNSSWLISLILAGIVAAIMGWYFGKRLTLPIVNLNLSMDAIKNGQLKQKLDVTSSDELGRLTEIFNEMSDRLDKSYKELESSNSLLSEYSNWLAAENKKAMARNTDFDKDDEDDNDDDGIDIS